MFDYIPNLFCFGFFAVFFALAFYGAHMQHKLQSATRNATQNPTHENALKVYAILSKRVRPKIKNHPDEWAKFRNMFYHVNGSPYVTTSLKHELKDQLIKAGLYINNVRIIDNYGKKVKNTTDK